MMTCVAPLFINALGDFENGLVVYWNFGFATISGHVYLVLGDDGSRSVWSGSKCRKWRYYFLLQRCT